MVERIEEKQALARENFVELDRMVRQLPDPADRSTYLRQIAELKGTAAPLLREDLALQTYRSGTQHSDYRGLTAPEASDTTAVAIKAMADREVARLAERYDLDPAASVARHAAPVISQGLGADYRVQEMAERAAGRAAHGEKPEDSNEAVMALSDFHARANAIYRDAAERMRELERDEPRGDRAGTLRDIRGETRAPERDDAPSPERPASGRVRDNDDRSR